MKKDIDSRISALERSVHRWQVLTLLLPALAVAPWLPRRVLPAISKLVPGVGTLTLDHLTTKWLDVVDDKGNTVISMNAGAGGGMLSVESATPHDPGVLIMASPYGADVTVCSHPKDKPRQFGQLKIMDGKPYLQMYEEGNQKNFYQATLYSEDGTIARSDNISVFSPTSQPAPPEIPIDDGSFNIRPPNH